MMKIAAYVVTLCGAVKAKDYVTLRASRPEVSSYLVPHVTAQANELVEQSQEQELVIPTHRLRAYASSNAQVENEMSSGDTFCDLDTSSIAPYLNPPNEVQDFIMMTFGIGWDIAQIGSFSEKMRNATNGGTHVCGELATIMNSTKDFVLLTIGDTASTSSELLMGDDAATMLCEREKERNPNNHACAGTTAEVEEKKVENPGSFALGQVLPICMGIRFCNDEDERDGSVKFGFVTAANNGDGINFGMIGPVKVSFSGLAFDTAGGLPFTFHSPLINPRGGSMIESSRGAHFLLTGTMKIPLTKKVLETDDTRDLGSIGITSAQIGMYSELEVDGTTTADIVKVIGHLGDLEELASGLDRLSFQLFFSVEALVSLNLGVLFPLPGDFNLTLFDGALSAMLEVQVQTRDRRNEKSHWYLGSAGQTCNIVCNIHQLQCTDNSINEQSSLTDTDEAHEAFTEAGVMCSDVRGGNTDVGAPFQSPDGCYKFTPGGSRSTCDANGSSSHSSLCYCEDGGTGVVAVTESTQTKNVAQCIHEDQTWMQDTYIALSVSAQLSTGDLDALLSPFNQFGEFLSGLLPGGNTTNTNNPVDDIETLFVAARVYLKLPLSGLAHFIIQFDASIVINCDIITTIKEWAGDMWEHLPGTPTIDAFCDRTEPTLKVTFSLGFEGFALDPFNSYLEFGAGDDKHRIDFDIFPTCPPPVLTGGSCTTNSDCRSSDSDPEATSCSAYDGYCMNNPTWRTARGCSGRCIDKLPNGADCSGSALHYPGALGWGDDDACESGRCSKDLTTYLTCQPKQNNGGGCLEDDDCASGRCAKHLRCEDKLPIDYRCGYNNDCQSNHCGWGFTGWFCMNDEDAELVWPVLE